MIVTAFTHPLDTATRKMQESLIKSTHTASFFKIITEHSIKDLMRGSGPRLGLASFGGATAGFFYDLYRKKLTDIDNVFETKEKNRPTLVDRI